MPVLFEYVLSDGRVTGKIAKEIVLLTDCWVDVHAICFDYRHEGPLFNAICLYLQILQAN